MCKQKRVGFRELQIYSASGPKQIANVQHETSSIGPIVIPDCRGGGTRVGASSLSGIRPKNKKQPVILYFWCPRLVASH